MSEYQLKTTKKVETAVVGTYKKIEGGVVRAYKRMEGKFVDAFLEKTDAPTDSAETGHGNGTSTGSPVR